MNSFERILGRTHALDAPAVLGDHILSYGDIIGAAEKLAREIRNLIPDDRRPVIALRLANSAEQICTYLAGYRIDGVLVPINPSAKPDEVEHILKKTGAQILISTPDTELLSMVGKTVRSTTWRNTKLYRLDATPPTDSNPGDRVVVFTSGSTGQPKGVVLTDDGLSNNFRDVAEFLALSKKDRSCVFTPPAYAYALNQIFSHLDSGASILPYPYGLLFPKELLRVVSETQLTGISANPTAFRIILGSRMKTILNLSQVRFIVLGGQPFDGQLAEQIMDLFPNARITTQYGCTENSPRITHYWLPSEVRGQVSPWPVGTPLPGTELKVVDEDGTPLPRGESGEIAVRGSSLMRGYWNAPDLTAARIKHGWFHTHDLGFLDVNGNLNITGRLDNVFSVGHEKVVPEEVEVVIERVDGVAEVAVASLPDPLLVHVPVAFVVATEKNSFDSVSDAIFQSCRNELSPPKVPREIIPVSTLPRTPYGKIDRRGVTGLVENYLSSLRDAAGAIVSIP